MYSDYSTGHGELYPKCDFVGHNFAIPVMQHLIRFFWSCLRSQGLGRLGRKMFNGVLIGCITWGGVSSSQANLGILLGIWGFYATPSGIRDGPVQKMVYTTVRFPGLEVALSIQTQLKCRCAHPRYIPTRALWSCITRFPLVFTGRIDYTIQ